MSFGKLFYVPVTLQEHPDPEVLHHHANKAISEKTVVPLYI